MTAASACFAHPFRYGTQQGVQRPPGLNFTFLTWPGRHDVLGMAEMPEGERVVRFNVEKSEGEVIGYNASQRTCTPSALPLYSPHGH